MDNVNIFDLKLRVTYYARVSTDNDSQYSSIVNQKYFFSNYINNVSNWIYLPGYIDEGISGKSVKDRSNFLRMIDDGINNKFDLILTKSVSRFARNTIDSIKYTDILKSKGVGVYFINDNIYTLNSDSEFRLTLMASIAQDEIRKLSESVKFGLSESINRGVVLGNNNILGYRKDKGKLVIDLDEAVIVRDIFSLFITNKYNYKELSLIINNKYDKRFNSSSIKRILTNYKYKGYYCGRKSRVINYKSGKRINLDNSKWIIYKDRNIPFIIDEGVWDMANNIISSKKRYKRKYNVICGIHNKSYRYEVKKYKNNIYSYYYCNGCNSIKEDLLDSMCNGYNVEEIYIYSYSCFFKVIINVNN
ncbi:MAG: recombinase family protein [Bacilli bacterium]|nr:recombinase family protein [Bacilli bacterium]